MGNRSLLLATVLILAAGPAVAGPPAQAPAPERRLTDAEVLEATRIPHPYAPDLTRLVASTMGKATPWGKFRDPDDGRRYVGHDACRPCHADRHATWKTTKMATALRTMADFKGGRFLDDLRCQSCHTTGFDPVRDNGGFDEGSTGMAGVQCEGCHGAGSLMVERADRRFIQRSTEAELCGRCHSERYGTGLCFPEFDEWNVSRHARSLKTLRASAAAADACLSCHSADAVVPFSDRPVTMATALTGVTCQACHDAMRRTFPELPDNNQLRLPKEELCQSCHSSATAFPGDPPHAPQGDLFAGRGGAEFPGEEYGDGPMNADITRGCLTCHAVSDRSIPNPYQGHAFTPNILACRRCHPDLGTFDRKGVQGEIRGLLLVLEGKIAAYPADWPKKESYRRAVWNQALIASDRSFGIHNTDYARKLLTDSIRFIDRDRPSAP